MTILSSFLRRWVYWTTLTCLYVIGCSQALQSFSYKWTSIDDHPQYALQKTLDHAAPKPYAYRLLMPIVVNLAAEHLPQQVVEPIVKRSKMALVSVVPVTPETVSDDLAVRYAITLWIDMAALVACAFLLRALARVAMTDVSGAAPLQRLLADVAPLMFLLLLSISYRTEGGFIYDHMELGLLLAYVLATYRGNRRVTLLLLIPASFNKETAVLWPLLALFITVGQGAGLRQAVTRNLPDLIAAVAAFVLIHWVLRDHPGANAEVHLAGNLRFWLTPSSYLAVTTPHHPLIPAFKPSHLLLAPALILCIVGVWREKPLSLRLPLMGSALLSLPLMLALCYRDEFRNLSLCFPFFYLGAVHTIAHYLTDPSDRHTATRPDAAS